MFAPLTEHWTGSGNGTVVDSAGLHAAPAAPINQATRTGELPMRTPWPAGQPPHLGPPPDSRASGATGPAGISRRALLRGTAATGAAVALAGAASVLTA